MTDYFKNYWRNVQKKIRQNLPKHYQVWAAEQIMHQIVHLSAFKTAQTIALYHAVHGEINLQPVWSKAEQQRKICVFPCVVPENILQFLPASTKSIFKNNRFGIPEPSSDKNTMVPIAQIDIMLIPLVVFDIFGNRIGMGGGYYDRSLAQQRPRHLIGVAYDFQRTSLIIPDPWDIPLQAIVTPHRMYYP